MRSGGAVCWRPATDAYPRLMSPRTPKRSRVSLMTRSESYRVVRKAYVGSAFRRTVDPVRRVRLQADRRSAYTISDPVVTDSPHGALVTIRAITRAGRSEIAAIRDGALVVRLNAAPVDGAANAELIEVIADALDVPKGAITITSGETS